MERTAPQALGKLNHETQIVKRGKTHPQRIALFEKMVQVTKGLTFTKGTIAEFTDGGRIADMTFIIDITVSKPIP